MRVLMLSWEWPPNMVGGLGKHVAELLPALATVPSRLYPVPMTVTSPPAAATCFWKKPIMRPVTLFQRGSALST